jgi:hypothetical protein
MRPRPWTLSLVASLVVGVIALGAGLPGNAARQESVSNGTVAGTWVGRYADIKGGVYAVRALLRQRGSTVSGTLFNPVRHVLAHGRIRGRRVTWTITFPSSGGRPPAVQHYRLTLKGDRLDGTIRSQDYVLELHLRRASRATSGATARVGLATARGPDAGVVVSPNVLVSVGGVGSDYLEPAVCVDPTDGRRLVADAMRGVRAPSSAPAPWRVDVFRSQDGGRSWARTAVSSSRTADPVCLWTRQGPVYWGAIDLLSHSDDGGGTWRALPRPGGLDRPFIVADETGGPFDGRLYLAGLDQLGNRMHVLRSDDGGMTFSTSSLVGRSTNMIGNQGNNVVLSDGSYVGLWQRLSTRSRAGRFTGAVTAVTSSDGGKTLRTYRVARFVSAGFITLPQLAAHAAGGQFKDHLYAVWVDGSSGSARIMFSRSVDRARTWSRPIQLDPAASQSSGFMPTIAVNRSGVIGVTWNDRRRDRGNLGYTVLFRASVDGGSSFRPPIRVSRQPARYSATGGHARFNVGEAAGLAADANGAFHAIWIGNHTGRQQVWTATITVR